MRYLAMILLAFGICTLAVSAGDDQTTDERTKTFDERAKVYVDKKLDSIVIPSLKFKKTDLRTAIDHVRGRSVQLDPDGSGVSFALDMDAEWNGPAVTLDLQDVSLRTTIRILCRLTDSDYELIGNVVVITVDSPAKDEDGNATDAIKAEGE